MSLDLSWEALAAGSVGLAVASAGLARVTSRLRPESGPPSARRRWLSRASGIARELAIAVALFALWELTGTLSASEGRATAVARGRWLWHAERVLHLPSEASLQRAFLPYPVVVQVLNLFYGVLDFPLLFVCLIWLAARHGHLYPRYRNIVVAFSCLCLMIQLIAVAPPRLLPGIHLVDTAARYGQSVYGLHTGFKPDQLSAMPSVHVGWAILIAIAIIGTTRSRWRWLALLYPVLTTLVVVVTANHFWLDGVVAAAILALVLEADRIARRLTLARSANRAVDVRPAGQAEIP